jgi:hypothetical protein
VISVRGDPSFVVKEGARTVKKQQVSEMQGRCRGDMGEI